MQEDKHKTNFSDIGKEIAIERLFEGSGYSNSGDFTLKNGQTLHKVMLEGVDFDLIYTPLKHLGYKAALSIIGDAYANMTTPKHLSIVLGISAKFYFEDICDLWCGFLACVKSDDKFLQYCGYLSVLNYVNNDFYESIDKNKNVFWVNNYKGVK